MTTDCSDEGCNTEAEGAREIVIGGSLDGNSEVDGSGNVEDGQQHTEPVVSNLNDSPESSVETIPDSATHSLSVNDDRVAVESMHLVSPSSSSLPTVKDLNEAVVETTSPSECDEETIAEDGMLPDSTPSVSTTSSVAPEMDSGGGGEGGGNIGGPCHQSEPEPMDED